MTLQDVWQTTNVPPSNLYDFAEDGRYTKLMVGEGENYGKVRLVHNENSPDEDHISTPYHPFSVKIDGDKIGMDLEGKSVIQHLDPNKEIFKNAIIFTEKIRTILKSTKDFSKLFGKDDPHYSALAFAMRKNKDLISAEYLYTTTPNKKDFKNKVQELAKKVHGIICIAEMPEGRKKWGESVSPLLKKLMKDSSKDNYLNFQKAEKTLIEEFIKK